MAHVPDADAVVVAEVGLGGVLEHEQPAVDPRRDVGRRDDVAEQVDRDDGPGARGEHRLHRLRREQQRVGVDVGDARAWRRRGSTASAVAMNVIDGTTTSSPGPTPRARNASARASVPEPTPAASGTPWAAANARSKRVELGPLDERAGAHDPVEGRVEVGPDRGVEAGEVQERDRGVVHRVQVSFLSRRASSSTCWSPSTAGAPSRRWW